MFTREEYLKNIKIHQAILERIEEVATEIGFLNAEYDTLDTEKLDYDEDYIYLTAYDSNYDMYDSIGCRISIDFLFENADKHKNWYQEMKKKEQEEALKKQKEKQEKSEWNEYQRLKAKYENL